jgi:hypothetical protein
MCFDYENPQKEKLKNRKLEKGMDVEPELEGATYGDFSKLTVTKYLYI